jgi:hypothetical protein
MTPEGFGHPGTLSVLSVCVRPDMAARISIHLRPPMLDEQEDGERDRHDRDWRDDNWQVRDREHNYGDRHDSNGQHGDGERHEDPHRQVGTVVSDSSGLPATSSAIFAYPR